MRAGSYVYAITGSQPLTISTPPDIWHNDMACTTSSRRNSKRSFLLRMGPRALSEAIQDTPEGDFGH